MTKYHERIQRYLLFSGLLFLNLCTIFFFITPLSTKLFRISTASFGTLTLFYACMCLCYRGFVEENHLENIEITPNSRECHICLHFKPERSHHCSRCKRCIRRMDHHCYWLGRCINYDNHGYFIRFLLFLTLDSLAILSQCVSYSYQIFIKNTFQISHGKVFILIVSVILSFLLFIVSFYHFNNQIYMMMRNITYIESINCSNYGYSESDSPYDFGIKNNVESILGPVKYLLLGRPAGNGMSFKKKYDVFYWPKHFRSSDKMYTQVI
ncbi:hypothetical protein GINT2_000148 [Glugoides intestinalis]